MGVLTAALTLLVLATMAAPSALAGQGDLSDDEINTMAGVGQHEPFSEDDRFGERILEAIEREPIANNGARATYTDKAYGDHPRNRFDLWIAEAEADDAARPLVVFVHGGGFQRGDKALLYDSSVLVELLEAGISVAGVNYRFYRQDERGVLGSLLDVVRFVQYIRHHAEEYRVDPQRIACYGGSAGGVASLWLAFHEDMAEPDHADPVRRESTRLRAAAGMATPATLDLLQWDWILDLDGFSDRELSDAAEHLGLADPELLFTEEGERIRARLDHLRLMSADDPPIFVRNIDEGGPAHGRARRGHHPYHARVLKQRAAEVGLRAYVSAPRIGIDAAEGRTLTSFLIEELSEPPTDD